MRPGPAGRNPKRSRLRRQKSRARSAARRFWVFRPADGRPFSRPSGAFQMCRLRRRRLPGPAPAVVLDLPRCARRGFRGNCRPWAARITGAFRRAPRVPLRTDEKERKVRLRGLHRPLRDPLEYLAITRRLPPLPTGTQAEGSIQVADAPNNAHRMARRGPAAKPRSFPPPRGRCAPRKSGRASPNVFSVRFRRLAGRSIAPAARRRAGCCTPVR